jgi:hypothetical protein
MEGIVNQLGDPVNQSRTIRWGISKALQKDMGLDTADFLWIKLLPMAESVWDSLWFALWNETADIIVERL